VIRPRLDHSPREELVEDVFAEGEPSLVSAISLRLVKRLLLQLCSELRRGSRAIVASDLSSAMLSGAVPFHDTREESSQKVDLEACLEPAEKDDQRLVIDLWVIGQISEALNNCVELIDYECHFGVSTVSSCEERDERGDPRWMVLVSPS
jgi:hypothetical protein